MIIRDIFEKPIDRPLEGVIKVGKNTEEAVFEEVNEYVVTKELRGYFSTFFEKYADALKARTNDVGVWISGFFGSGKSHFLKILSYILENREIRGKRAYQYFEDKIDDPMIVANMKAASDYNSDVLLFNIDSVSDADARSNKEGLVKVFNKMFNKMQGFSESMPWLAELERQMVKNGTYEEFMVDYNAGRIAFPVFVKPRTGSGSVGARKIEIPDLLKQVTEQDKSLIIQELMTGKDLDADVYVDTISHKPVAIFSKKKLSTTIGGANKTVSFKDESLFAFIQEALSVMQFNGPLDMDFFYQDGKYYLSEINPRFGGAYLHAYGAGVDFVKLIQNNVAGIENPVDIGNYEEDIVMMMYDSVVIRKMSELEDSMISMM